LQGGVARTLACEILTMTQEAFSRAFRSSPVKHAKLRKLRRGAGVMLGDVGASGDVGLPERSLDDPELTLPSAGVRQLGGYFPQHLPEKQLDVQSRANAAARSTVAICT
jgi:hypothetical protein